MEVVLASDKGRMVWQRCGDILTTRFPSKNVRFPLAGKYKFEFERHA